MNKSTITEVEAELRRFLSKLEALKATDKFKAESSKYTGVGGCPESAALRRSSLDLTKALAKLRKY